MASDLLSLLPSWAADLFILVVVVISIVLGGWLRERIWRTRRYYRDR